MSPTQYPLTPTHICQEIAISIPPSTIHPSLPYHHDSSHHQHSWPHPTIVLPIHRQLTPSSLHLPPWSHCQVRFTPPPPRGPSCHHHRFTPLPHHWAVISTPQTPTVIEPPSPSSPSHLSSLLSLSLTSPHLCSLAQSSVNGAHWQLPQPQPLFSCCSTTASNHQLLPTTIKTGKLKTHLKVGPNSTKPI